MSLLSTDVTKKKQLSLREVKLDISKRKNKEAPEQERPPTEEEKTYSKLVAINPQLEKLVKRFDLVSQKTGEPLQKVELNKKEPEEEREVENEEPAPDADKLTALAKQIIPEENSYTREEILQRLKDDTKVSQARAENGFNLMLQVGAIEATLRERYYLAESTPF